MHIGQCKTCGKIREYKYKSWVKTFCSYSCARADNPAKLIPLKCDSCGKEKHLTKTALSGRSGKYCSLKCSAMATRKEKTFSNVNCSLCGTDTKKRTDKLLLKNYCSNECRSNARKVETAKWRDKEQIKTYMKIYAKAYAQKKPHMITMHVAKRRAAKRLATPKWADANNIKFVYKLSNMAHKIHGIKYEVDHIYPLISDVVCGLHVYENLQILPKQINRQKSNVIQD